MVRSTKIIYLEVLNEILNWYMYFSDVEMFNVSLVLQRVLIIFNKLNLLPFCLEKLFLSLVN